MKLAPILRPTPRARAGLASVLAADPLGWVRLVLVEAVPFHQRMARGHFAAEQAHAAAADDGQADGTGCDGHARSLRFGPGWRWVSWRRRPSGGPPAG